MAGDIKTIITLPLLGIIYIAALVIIIIQHFAGISFGMIGFFSWLIVIVGSIGFIISIVAQMVNH